MTNLAIYGAGGLGREVACMIDKINRNDAQWNLIGFFDDGIKLGESISHFGKCIGGIDELNAWPSSIAVALCFGSPSTLRRVRIKISNDKVSFPNLIDPSFSVADIQTFKLGEGNIIKGHCSVTTDVTIGDFNIMNGFINIGHDVSIGNYNVFMPGVRISGEVSIGEANLMGADSFIKQGLKIGNDVTLSPLSALLTKPKDNTVYIGNPARIFKY